MGKKIVITESELTVEQEKYRPLNWSEMDSLRTELNVIVRPHVEGGFTLMEYAKQYGVTYDVAKVDIRRMAKAGRIAFIGYRQGHIKAYAIADKGGKTGHANVSAASNGRRR